MILISLAVAAWNALPPFHQSTTELRLEAWRTILHRALKHDGLTPDVCQRLARTLPSKWLRDAPHLPEMRGGNCDDSDEETIGDIIRRLETLKEVIDVDDELPQRFITIRDMDTAGIDVNSPLIQQWVTEAIAGNEQSQQLELDSVEREWEALDTTARKARQAEFLRRRKRQTWDPQSV